MVVAAETSRVGKRFSKLLCSRLKAQPMSLLMAVTWFIQSLVTCLAKA